MGPQLDRCLQVLCVVVLPLLHLEPLLKGTWGFARAQHSGHDGQEVRGKEKKWAAWVADAGWEMLGGGSVGCNCSPTLVPFSFTDTNPGTGATNSIPLRANSTRANCHCSNSYGYGAIHRAVMVWRQ